VRTSDGFLAQAAHLAIAGLGVVLVSDEVQGPVRREESDLARERPPAAPCLPPRLLRRDDDVSELERAVGRALQELARRRAARPRGQHDPEGEHVGDAFLAAMARIQIPHRGVVNEGERDLGTRIETRRHEDVTDGGTREPEVAGGAPADDESQRASRVPVRAGSCVMRSSGYGIRS